jgi:hypothetical protein
MTVQEAIAAAESRLPDQPAPEGQTDQRWQAIIAVGGFIESDPEAVWTFVARWGSSPDEDLRTAIATCLLEHLLEHHFDAFMERVELGARANRNFGDMVRRCWKFGQTQTPDRSERFDQLIASIRRHDKRQPR